MLAHRLLIAATLIAGSLFALPASAGTALFTAEDFDAAKAAGKPVLVEITAPWCPTCRAQKPIIGKLLESPKFKDFAAFAIDFDSQKKAVRSLKANTQSTLIVFKGAEEVGRSVGATDPAVIEALLAKAL